MRLVLLLLAIPHAAAAEWTDKFAQAEAFLPPRVSSLLPKDIGVAALEVKWAADESWLEWTASDGNRQRVLLPSGKLVAADSTSVPSKSAASPGEVLSRDGRFRVYAENHNLYVADQAGTRALTADGELWRTFDARYAESNPRSRAARSVAPPLVQFLGDSSWLVAERYWGDPRSGPAGGPRGYATNVEEVARLKGALLLIHGETDSDVPVANTFRVVDALVHANKLFDLLILPGQDHAFRYPDATADAYARRRTWKYLTEHLLTE